MSTEKEKMLAGQLYFAGDPELVEERARTKKLLREFNLTLSRFVLSLLMPDAQSGIIIEPPFHCDYGYNIECGENVFFNVNCVVLDVCKVKIGSNVFFGPAVQIYTATHPLEHVTRRKLESGRPVTIGDDCWIGGGAIILPGVTIGHRCIVGAGAVVTKDVPDDTIVAGNPAKVLRRP